ncbi:hypothetical protein CDAR_6801 [Caerostris darwini]|uniref:BED-type domain-containing protein n=1 Tax=Caerostris darwini TaxID=1538125 RepID=A0AAV4TBU5_9ARAC|nr:hypothetical protein CDAR_6801 [Caerostris darwini]
MVPPILSTIWRYFIAIDSETTKCILCDKVYSRKGRSTTLLKNHLKNMHPHKYYLYIAGREPSVAAKDDEDKKKDDEGDDEKSDFLKRCGFRFKRSRDEAGSSRFWDLPFSENCRTISSTYPETTTQATATTEAADVETKKTLDELEEQYNQAINSCFNAAELNDSSHDSSITLARHFSEPDSRPRKRFRFDPLVPETTSENNPVLRPTTDPDEMMLLSQIPVIKKFSPSTKLLFQIQYLKLVQTFKG